MINHKTPQQHDVFCTISSACWIFFLAQAGGKVGCGWIMGWDKLG